MVGEQQRVDKIDPPDSTSVLDVLFRALSRGVWMIPLVLIVGLSLTLISPVIDVDLASVVNLALVALTLAVISSLFTYRFSSL
jgi:hypothetical protein